MKVVKPILVQLVIFLAYFIVANLFLLNRQGGADILCVALTALCLIVHFVIVFVKFARSKEAVLVGFLKVVTVFMLVVLFLLFVDGYLSMMLTLTS
ncbi:MAG: hypothetical protein EOO42_01765 [Flavobacteriales bacterium]|nr:MAG: hypothetical protein EOO42_01765 [Flavobacteriales bacterium]